MNKPRFTVDLFCYHWSCGDGCCSDSGFKIQTWDRQEQKMIHDDIDWSSHWYYGPLLEDSLGRIEDILGKEPEKGEDYQLTFLSSSDDNEYEDYDLEWRK